ncbi:hypothetical protein DUNSADRAFT_13309, partial [Dunaliella salina]
MRVLEMHHEVNVRSIEGASVLSMKVDATDCHFAYRMIMVLLRRELTLEQALELWEMLWADSLLHSVPCYRGLLQRMGA